jgi:hypothetical protein
VFVAVIIKSLLTSINKNYDDFCAFSILLFKSLSIVFFSPLFAVTLHENLKVTFACAALSATAIGLLEIIGQASTIEIENRPLLGEQGSLTMNDSVFTDATDQESQRKKQGDRNEHEGEIPLKIRRGTMSTPTISVSGRTNGLEVDTIASASHSKQIALSRTLRRLQTAITKVIYLSTAVDPMLLCTLQVHQKLIGAKPSFRTSLRYMHHTLSSETTIWPRRRA